MNVFAIVASVLICVGMAALGGILAGDGVREWYPRIRKPAWQVPLWFFYVIGGVVYFIDGIILYRLMVHVADFRGRTVLLLALLVVMLFNELWNYLFFQMRDLFAALVALLSFVAPLLILQVSLFLYEPVSAFVLLPYTVWYFVYNVPWGFALWRLNRGRGRNSGCRWRED